MIEITRIDMTASLEVNLKVTDLSELDKVREKLIREFNLGTGSTTDVRFTISSTEFAHITYPNKKKGK